MTKHQAANTAAHSLQNLEIWMRRTCITCNVAAATTTITDVVSLGAVYKYWRIMTALSVAQAKVAAGFKDFQTDLAKSPFHTMPPQAYRPGGVP
jgi:hypothetical protein